MISTLNDIVVACKLASRLYNQGSSRYTSAHQEYHDFIRDIDGLREQLDVIRVEYQQFQTQSSYSPSIDFSSLNLATNGIQHTLKRCEKLLNDKKSFEIDSYGFIKNVIWNSRTAQHVRDLQTRLAFHLAKVQLVMEPWKLKINSHLVQVMALVQDDADDQFQQVKAKLDVLIKGMNFEELREQTTIQVPEVIVTRFEEIGSKHQPIKRYSIQEGLDAIVLHWTRSTLEFKRVTAETSKPPIIQYLNLLKAIWLFEKIKQRDTYPHFCSDPLSQAYVRQLDRRIQKECRRFLSGTRPLEKPANEELLAQKEEAFEIWPDLGIRDVEASLIEAVGFETEILRAPVEGMQQGGKQELRVFRLNESRLRLAQFSTTVTGLNTNTKETSEEVDRQQMVLIPVYAHPLQDNPACSMMWKSTLSDERSRTVVFSNIKYLKKFQEAVTNFGIKEDQKGLKLLRGKTSWHDGAGKELGNNGRVQIWLHQRYQSHSMSTTSTSPTTSNSHMQHSSFTKSSGSSSTRGWTRSHAASHSKSSSIRIEETGAFLDRPIPAIAVFFTSKKGRDGTLELRFVTIEIDENTYWNRNGCRCGSGDGTCERLVLESKQKLHIRIFRPNGPADRVLENWNIAALAQSPRDFSSANAGMTVEEVEASFVTIDMEAPSRRADLSVALEMTCNIIKNRVNEHHKELRDFKTRHLDRDG